MRCDQIMEKLSPYMDGELERELCAQIEEHLRGCEQCSLELRAYRRVDVALAELSGRGAAVSGQMEGSLKIGTIYAPVASEELKPSAGEGVLSRLLRILESFMDLLEGSGGRSHRVLDEFGDFPPQSLSYIYFRLLHHPG